MALPLRIGVMQLAAVLSWSGVVASSCVNLGEDRLRALLLKRHSCALGHSVVVTLGRPSATAFVERQPG